MNTMNIEKGLITWRFHSACAMGIITFISLAVKINADQSSQTSNSIEIQAIKTEMVHGFCIGLAGWNGDLYTNNTSADDNLAFLAWTTNVNSYGYNTRITVPTEPEYAYLVQLFDTNGVAVPKTKVGETVGANFFDFDSNAYRNGIAINHLRAGELGKMTGAPLLFRPSDFFKIEKPGHYTLQIRFQIMTFPRTGPNQGDYTNDLIRFPPLDYPLVKLDTTSPKTP